MTESTESARDKLVDDFAAVLAEAEEMLKRAATETGDKARDLRSQVETQAAARQARACRRSRARRSTAPRPRRARPTTTCTTIRGRRSASRPRSASLVGLLMNRR